LLTSQDKEVLAKILRDAGTRKNILVSIFPEENTVREQSYLVYGKRTNSGIGQVFNKYYSNSLELIGW
jgi:hypothetical protein